jgi:hypothetical protein
LKSLFPGLKIVFTISPVRHWKDGAHGNQISKSILFLAVEELLNHPVAPHYFPAYEIVNDDLRDYRFYGDDMLHPSATAINYIWNAFTGCYLESSTVNIWNEVVKITKACNHRSRDESILNLRNFADRMLSQISEIESKVPFVDFSAERKYFRSLSENE